MHLRRVAAALGRCAGVVVCVDACDARGCMSTLRLGCRASFCVCVPCGIHSLFAVAVLLLCAERLFARAWYRCGRVVTCASVAVSLACCVG
jgi:hypothetical protein